VPIRQVDNLDVTRTELWRTRPRIAAGRARPGSPQRIEAGGASMCLVWVDTAGYSWYILG